MTIQHFSNSCSSSIQLYSTAAKWFQPAALSICAWHSVLSQSDNLCQCF